MGQDGIVSGGEFNAKMSYSSGGIQNRNQLNEIGQSLNMMSGQQGISIDRGLDGGIAVDGEALKFPWDKISFGYEIGVLDGDVMDYTKIKIYFGYLYVADDANTDYPLSPGSSFSTDRVPAAIEELYTEFPLVAVGETAVDIIYLKHTYSLEGYPAVTELIIESGEDYEAATLESDLLISYTPLYAFYIAGSSTGQGVCEHIYHLGDVSIYRPHDYVLTDIMTSAHWDETEHSLVGVTNEYFMLPTGRRVDEEFDIAIAVDCPTT
jgi:hypothetical protein